MASKKQDRDTKLQQGIAQHFKGKTISFGGSEQKVADVVGALESNVQSWNDHDRAKIASHQAFVKANATEAAVAPTRRALVAFIVAHFGASSPVLTDFGLTPKKDRRKLDTDEKVLMVQRIRATRTARGTMGPRQRAQIHGVVAPAAVAATPAPAPALAAPTPVAQTPSPAPVATVPTNGASVLSLNGLNGHS